MDVGKQERTVGERMEEVDLVLRCRSGGAGSGRGVVLLFRAGTFASAVAGIHEARGGGLLLAAALAALAY